MICATHLQNILTTLIGKYSCISCGTLRRLLGVFVVVGSRGLGRQPFVVEPPGLQVVTGSGTRSLQVRKR